MVWSALRTSFKESVKCKPIGAPLCMEAHGTCNTCSAAMLIFLVHVTRNV